MFMLHIFVDFIVSGLCLLKSWVITFMSWQCVLEYTISLPQPHAGVEELSIRGLHTLVEMAKLS